MLFPASQYTSRLVNYFPNRKYDSGFGRWGGWAGVRGQQRELQVSCLGKVAPSAKALGDAG